MKQLSPEALGRFRKLMAEKFTIEASDEYQKKHGNRGLAWALREQARKETRRIRWPWQKKR